VASFWKTAEATFALVIGGKIGGGRKGIGPALFRDHFVGKPQSVIDGDQESCVFLVGAVKSPRLLQQIQFFVREVERVKQLVDHANPSRTSGTSSSGSFGDKVEIRDVGDEFEGKKRYARSGTVEAVCDHGIIVNTLRKCLKERGYQVGKDQYRDIYVHKGQKITSLFEVKPSMSTGSLYSAIGQLMFHSTGFAPSPGLFFVAPIELATDIRKKLKALEIEVIGYRWVDGVPDFPDLAHWDF